MTSNESFTFAISLSVLDHLGRKLYRKFSTVLGEAISNSWDAGANNVWIHIDKNKNSFYVMDDGEGMNADDFQNKFLKVGYSKRKDGEDISPDTGRPYIGRKGIGKLALLSCANRIHVISKVEGGDYIGGVIDNKKLDDAITKDLIPEEYPLEKVDPYLFHKFTKDHKKGTIIYFEDLKEGIKNSLEFLRKTIALYFRFSLYDEDFNIFLEDEKVTFKDLSDLSERTEFLWKVGDIEDPYIDNLSELSNVKEIKTVKIAENVGGFIASVIKPRDLKIATTDGRLSVDLFVNGRLREKDILKHIPTARVVEDYLYGQIHFDDLDKGEDRFTSSREGIVANDEKYEKFLDDLKIVISLVLSDWDKWRIKHREDGDSENPSIPLKDRKAGELYNVISKEYVSTEEGSDPEDKKKIDGWIDDLGDDAKYNFSSYAECFISENLVRNHIQEKNLPIPKEASDEVTLRKGNEVQNKNKGNINIDIRKDSKDTSYLSMDHLANLVDKSKSTKDPGLSRDAYEYKPIRDALMHTALLTDSAKQKLTTIKENIKGRVKNLLSSK